MYLSPSRAVAHTFPRGAHQFGMADYPPRDLFATIPPSHKCSILSLGCGDMRSVFFSLWLHKGTPPLFLSLSLSLFLPFSMRQKKKRRNEAELEEDKRTLQAELLDEKRRAKIALSELKTKVHSNPPLLSLSLSLHRHTF